MTTQQKLSRLNWRSPEHDCVNRLRLKGAPQDIADFMEQAQGPEQMYAEDKLDKIKALSSVFSFHRLVPIPEPVLSMPYSPYGRAAELMLWGPKWGGLRAVISASGRSCVEYEFYTAWEPPMPFLIRLSRRFPTLKLSYTYRIDTDSRRTRMILEKGIIAEHLDVLPGTWTAERKLEWTNFFLTSSFKFGEIHMGSASDKNKVLTLVEPLQLAV